MKAIILFLSWLVSGESLEARSAFSAWSKDSRGYKKSLLIPFEEEVSSNLFSRRSLLATSASGIALSFHSYQANAVDPPSLTKKTYQVVMEVSLNEKESGEIVIEIIPEWAPKAALRFQDLLDDDFFVDAKFFRVLPGYIAQFGIAGSPDLNKKWMFDKSKAMMDEPRTQSNKKGTLSFASSGKNSRQTQMFINLSNNDGPPNFLDAQGFVPFGRVVKGMDDVVPKLYSGYGLVESVSAGLSGSVNQAKAAYYGNEYLDTVFPKLSTIKSVHQL